MSIQIYQWAVKHHVKTEALNELMDIFGMFGNHLMSHPLSMASEAAVQAAVRLEAAKKGIHLFRNNVGALLDARGVPVRYGLANESKQINAKIKSGDLIGWRTITITPAHVGFNIAQFVSRECKPSDWTYTGDAHEQAQLAWAQLVTAGGGDASFCTGEGTL